MKIWVVIGEDGEYSDRVERPVAAYRTEAAAKAYIESIPGRRQEVSERMLAFYDRYRIEEVELMDDAP